MQANFDAAAPAAQRLPLDRFLAVALIVAAVVQLIAGVLHPEDSPAGMAQPSWQPLHMIFFLTLFVVLLAVIRIYGSIAARGGWVAGVAIILFTFGIVGFEGLMLLEVGVFPQLAAADATRPLLSESGPLLAGPLGGWLVAAGVTFSVGGILFAVSLLRDGGWPRWAAALLLIAPVVAFSPPLPLWAWKVGFAVFSVGLAGLGTSLWHRAG